MLLLLQLFPACIAQSLSRTTTRSSYPLLGFAFRHSVLALFAILRNSAHCSAHYWLSVYSDCDRQTDRQTTNPFLPQSCLAMPGAAPCRRRTIDKFHNWCIRLPINFWSSITSCWLARCCTFQEFKGQWMDMDGGDVRFNLLFHTHGKVLTVEINEKLFGRIHVQGSQYPRIQ